MKKYLLLVFPSCLITNRLHIPQARAIHTYCYHSQQILYQPMAKFSHAFYSNLNKHDERGTTDVCKWIDLFCALSTTSSVSMRVDDGIMKCVDDRIMISKTRDLILPSHSMTLGIVLHHNASSLSPNHWNRGTGICRTAVFPTYGYNLSDFHLIHHLHIGELLL